VKSAVVVGAGPAGLMAAEALADAGFSVLIADQKPSVSRKFLRAGKSGLNLTKDEPLDVFLKAYGTGRKHLKTMISEFGPGEVSQWALDLGQEIFTGSSGRVFPKAMKASPLLRSWLARLASKGVTIQTRWSWVGFDAEGLRFETPDGTFEATVRDQFWA
jgi:predicted flavoprotein YhiN